MTFQQDLRSWMGPSPVETSSVPETGAKAPSSSKLKLPDTDGKPVVITFLRHCGCPFAEITFKQLRDAASQDENRRVHFIAVSHSDEQATETWLTAVGGKGDGTNNVDVVVDPERQLYGAWGLGTSSLWHVLNPWSLYSI